MTVSRSLPKISCLLVTKDRLVCVKQAIDCYVAQDYPNRELVIVSEGDPFYRDAIARYIKGLDREDIRLVYAGNDPNTLGRARNLAMDEATGDLLCQWDDDDLYAPKRLSTQADELIARKADASCFTDQLQLFVEARELYWVDWKQPYLAPIHQLIPGTLMMHRDVNARYPEVGECAVRGEDSHFLEQIATTGSIAPLSGAGYLYVYTYHGVNTFDENHHREIQRDYAVDATFWEENILHVTSLPNLFNLPRPLKIMASSGASVATF